MGSTREGSEYWSLDLPNRPRILSVLLLTAFPSLSVSSKCPSWTMHPRWCFQMNFSVNMIGNHLGPRSSSHQHHCRNNLETIPPCTISGFILYNVPSHLPPYLVLTSALWGKQTLYRKKTQLDGWSTASATVNFNSALAKDELSSWGELRSPSSFFVIQGKQQERCWCNMLPKVKPQKPVPVM